MEFIIFFVVLFIIYYKVFRIASDVKEIKILLTDKEKQPVRD